MLDSYRYIHEMLLQLEQEITFMKEKKKSLSPIQISIQREATFKKKKCILDLIEVDCRQCDLFIGNQMFGNRLLVL